MNRKRRRKEKKSRREEKRIREKVNSISRIMNISSMLYVILFPRERDATCETRPKKGFSSKGIK